MWRYFLRQHFGPVGALMFGALSLVIYHAGTCRAQTASSEVPAKASAEEEISRTAQADRAVVIREHAGWNMDCEAIAHPALRLNEPPRHGSVCARIQDIKIRSMFTGTQAQCIGQVVRGVQLIYRPDAGFTGDDRLRYAAQYPSVLRPVTVDVTVTPFASAAPSRYGETVPPARQVPGEVPACEDLVF
jgi:hypothetical protein